MSLYISCFTPLLREVSSCGNYVLGHRGSAFSLGLREEHRKISRAASLIRCFTKARTRLYGDFVFPEMSKVLQHLTIILLCFLPFEVTNSFQPKVKFTINVPPGAPLFHAILPFRKILSSKTTPSTVALERTSIISRIPIRRKAHSNSDTSIAGAKCIKLLRSPDEAQLPRIVPLNLSSAPLLILFL